MNTIVDPTVYRLYKDGNAWCAVSASFVNLQESLAGFGDDPMLALNELISAEKSAEQDRRKSPRQFKCGNCQSKFWRMWRMNDPPCPHCSAGGQYTYEVKS